MARSQLSQLFKTSMESESTDDTVEVEMGMESLEYANLEIQEASMEADSLEQDVAELEEIHSGLESVYESVEASMEQGGLDPVAAQFVHHAVGSYTERLGMESEEILPALEAFGGDTGRESSTSVSMEGIGEVIKNIWKAIRNAIEKAIKAVRDFFGKIFSNTDKMKKRLEAAKKKVSDAKGSPQGKMRVPNAGQLAYEGDVSASAIAKGIGETDTLVSAMLNEYLDAASGTMDSVAKALKEADLSKRGKIEEGFKTLFLNSSKRQMAALDKAGVEGEVKLLQDKLAKAKASGGKAVKVEAKEANGGHVVEVTFGDAEGAKKVEDAEIDTPDKGAINSAIDNAMKLTDTIGGAKKAIDDAVKAYDAMKKAGDDASKQAEKAEGGESDKEGEKAVGFAMRFAARDLTAPVRKSISHAWGVCSATVSYAETAAKNYGEKKEES